MTDNTQNQIIPKESNDNEMVVQFDSPEKILSYGKEASQGISSFSDKILSQFNLSFGNESSKLLKTLANLMNQFDKGDFQEANKKGFFEKLFSGGKKLANDIYSKYTVYSKEIDKIFIEIKKYEYDITDTNQMLDNMYEENMNYYAELDKYILDCRKYIKENIEPEIINLSEKTDDGYSQIQLVKLNEIKEMLEQRIYDLELAKAVSFQIAPKIKLIQKGNYNLVRKINSAFVITLPLFKQGIIEAITLKQQKLQAESLSALDESTNKLLKQNAQNIVKNTKEITQLNQSSIRIETLVESYNTIINGIKEVEQIQEENKIQREANLTKMEELKTALLQGKPITEKTEEAS